MTKAEFDKLWRLLGTYWPNAQQAKNADMRLAWWYAVQPINYDDAKAAVIAYTRKNKFFPDVADVTSGLIPEEPDAGDDSDHYHSPAYIAEIRKYVDRMFSDARQREL